MGAGCILTGFTLARIKNVFRNIKILRVFELLI